MKTNLSILVLIFSICFGFTSCNSDDDKPAPSISVNDFVWKSMNLWYYWQGNVPNLADDAFQTDEAYQQFISSHPTDNLFFNLLYSYGTVDRFSWIVENYQELNQQFAGINKSFGMKYGLVLYDNQQIFGYVQYVIPNSQADLAGLKRGDIFNRINGSQINTSNYIDLLNNEQATFGMAYLENGQLHPLNIEVQLNKIEVQENPVYLTKVFEYGSQKIGYLVYNNFRANFNVELNNAIGELKSQGITDLILDLRYNGGGSVQTATYLASMITGQFADQIFTKLFFNSKASNNNSTYNFVKQGKSFDNDLNQNGEFLLNQLQLNRLYVITSTSTASASEMIISCLKPYISVQVIGGKTVGKTVGSITLYDNPNSYYTNSDGANPTHTWALQPIVFEYKNSLDQPSPYSGIEPDQSISEIQYLEDLPELGNVEEPLLAQTLSQIISSSAFRTQPSIGLSQFKWFKDSKNLEKFGQEMYLDKGFEINP